MPPLQRVILTGADGFVGRHLQRLLRASGLSSIIGTGLRDSPNVDFKMDLNDMASVEAVISRERPDAVIHLAAQASVGSSYQAGAKTWAVNLGGTLNLACAIAQFVPEATILFASSSDVYGRAFGREPLDETAVPQPVSAYARSKLMAEQMLAEMLPPTARLLVARPFNHTGPGQREDFVLPSFAGQIARIEAGVQSPALHVGNLDVCREFLDVRDVAKAYVALLGAAPRLPARFTCNIATGTARSLGEVLEAMRRLARVPFSVEVDPARLRPSDIPRAAGCAARLAEATGWTATVPFNETLADLLDDARRRVRTAA